MYLLWLYGPKIRLIEWKIPGEATIRTKGSILQPRLVSPQAVIINEHSINLCLLLLFTILNNASERALFLLSYYIQMENFN
jgi:hypothetical protein